MDNLTMDLRRMCRHNRDGSYGTFNNRLRGLIAIAAELRTLGYKLPGSASLKPKHVSALVEHWHSADLDDATIRNRLTWLRWWAAKIDKPNVVERDNAAYNVAAKAAPRRNRAYALDPTKFHAIECPYVRASVLLQATFGLRREEAIKFQPATAIQRNQLVLKPSWTKGGRGRTIPITTAQQAKALQQICRLVNGKGSLIPPRMTYVEQLKRYEYFTLKAGLRNTHGLRHAYAQQRYLTLTGRPCPLAGGKHWHQLTPIEREGDRAARYKISGELGHGRLAITDTYLGRACQ